MINKKKSPLSSRGNSKRKHLHNISLSSQRRRLLVWLRKQPITTIQARHELNILAPAARVWELRHIYDLNIFTYWEKDFTPEGRRHSVAKYVLKPGSFNKENQGGIK